MDRVIFICLCTINNNIGIEDREVNFSSNPESLHFSKQNAENTDQSLSVLIKSQPELTRYTKRVILKYKIRWKLVGISFPGKLERGS